jgi:hypothetical protein
MYIAKWRTDESYLAEIVWQNHPNDNDPFDAILATSKNIGYRKLKISLNFFPKKKNL